MARVAEIVAAERPLSVLDVGCGDGYLLGTLPTTIPIRRGVDIDDRALAFARAFFPDVDYRGESIAAVQEQFDVVCAIEVVEHIPDEEVNDFLRATAACLKPGGLLLISVPTTNLPLNPKHFRHYDRVLLRSQIVEAVPAAEIEAMDYYYTLTAAERLYRRLTRSAICQGEIPLVRRAVWRYARRKAGAATDRNGHHLIARIRRRS
jgi:2-polyprenyl-3-methyl-5-hydroxy-6-metoxy-1,4-benzoquinol methylase